MEKIQDFINFFLVIIPIAGAVRGMYCLIAMSADTDEDKSYKIRLRNLLIFVILAESITSIVKLVFSYFGV